MLRLRRCDCAWPVSAFVVSVALLAGCQVRKYELDLTPRAGQLERKLTVYEQRTDPNRPEVLPVADEELIRIAAAYAVESPKGGGPKHSFVKQFVGQLPDDVGGRGTFTHWSTSLGSTTAYLERVRGNDDLAANLDARREAVRRLVALLVGWSETEIGTSPEWPRLRAFLEGSLQRDLVNLSIYLKSMEFLAQAAPSDKTSSGQDAAQPESTLLAHSMRIGQYFVEREYLTPDQLPDWMYAVDQARQQRPERLVALAQRWLATRIGVPADQPIPASLARLGEWDGVSESLSLRRYLEASDDYRLLRQRWEALPEGRRGTEPPAPNQVLADLVVQAFLPGNVFLGGHQLEARLHLPRAPLLTNGVWKEDEHRVEWTATFAASGESDLIEAARPIPTLLLAIWVEPSAEWQLKHFGKVALNDDKLAYYCLWRRGLPDEKARQWEEFLASLKPGPDLSERIKGFHFADEPLDNASANLSRDVRELIVAELKP